jgi:tRNA (guanine-N(7)-)-methyltransferase subunit TRM82
MIVYILHHSYVSAIVCPRFASDRLISGGGDERLLVWDYLSGKILQAVDLKAAILGAGSDNPLDMRRIKSSSINDVAVIFDKYVV